MLPWCVCAYACMIKNVETEMEGVLIASKGESVLL